MYKKKVKCASKVVVLPTKTIVVFDFLVAVASSDRKVPFFSHEAATWSFITYLFAKEIIVGLRDRKSLYVVIRA